MMSPKCSIVLHTQFLPQQNTLLGCTHCFWFSTLWFIDENASFFHFFHKMMNIRSWLSFSSSKIRMQFSHTFCNITMIFKICRNIFRRCSSVYTTIFFRRKGKTNYLSNQKWAKCYHSWNKNVRWRTLYNLENVSASRNRRNLKNFTINFLIQFLFHNVSYTRV